jgi:hypothetical protein
VELRGVKHTSVKKKTLFGLLLDPATGCSGGKIENLPEASTLALKFRILEEFQALGAHSNSIIIF